MHQFFHLLQSLMAIISAMSKLRIDFNDRTRLDDARQFFEMVGQTSEGEMTYEIGQLMKRLWNDRGKISKNHIFEKFTWNQLFVHNFSRCTEMFCTIERVPIERFCCLLPKRIGSYCLTKLCAYSASKLFSLVNHVIAVCLQKFVYFFAGRTQNQSQNHGYHWNPIHLQRPAFQNVWCRWSKIREEKMDSLFWR